MPVLRVGVGVAVGEADAMSDLIAVAIAVAVAVAAGARVAVRVGVTVGGGTRVAVAEGMRVRVGIGVRVGIFVRVRVDVAASALPAATANARSNAAIARRDRGAHPSAAAIVAGRIRSERRLSHPRICRKLSATACRARYRQFACRALRIARRNAGPPPSGPAPAFGYRSAKNAELDGGQVGRTFEGCGRDAFCGST
jgi:hypothetical protein